MNRRVFANLLLAGTLTGSAAWLRAQEAPRRPLPPEAVIAGGPGDGMLPGLVADGVELLGFEGLHGGQVVTAAPFSAVAVQETTQTLADGNHISRKSQVNLFRDSQGRFRKEVTLSGFALAAAMTSAKDLNGRSGWVATTLGVCRSAAPVRGRSRCRTKGSAGRD